MDDGIYVNMQELAKQIADLVTLQNELNQEKNDIESAKREMVDNWSGDEADKAYEKLSAAIQTLETAFTDLEKTKNHLNAKSEGFQNTITGL